MSAYPAQFVRVHPQSAPREVRYPRAIREKELPRIDADSLATRSHYPVLRTVTLATGQAVSDAGNGIGG